MAVTMDKLKRSIAERSVLEKTGKPFQLDNITLMMRTGRKPGLKEVEFRKH